MISLWALKCAHRNHFRLRQFKKQNHEIEQFYHNKKTN